MSCYPGEVDFASITGFLYICFSSLGIPCSVMLILVLGNCNCWKIVPNTLALPLDTPLVHVWQSVVSCLAIIGPGFLLYVNLTNSF